MSGTSGWAAAYAEELLDRLGDRWRHTAGVAERGRRAEVILDDAERQVLLAATWLHDIGYAPALVVTGFHPIDGARHLRDLGRERLAGLVAYHSGGPVGGGARGLAEELGEFQDEGSAVTKLLTYCDMTTGPRGESFTLDERLAEIERRYGPEHVVMRSLCDGARP